jgi:hypothetical protein
MRINKIIFPCTAIALLLVACGETPEPVVERSQLVVGSSPAALKSSFAINFKDNPNLSKMNKAVDDIFNSKGKEYASFLKQNCSEEDLKVLEQLNSCLASAKDKPAFEKCYSLKFKKDECSNAALQIVNEVTAEAMKANTQLLW